MKLAIALLALAFTTVVQAQTTAARLSPVSDSIFGDSWAPYISVSTLTAVQRFGRVRAETDLGTEDLQMSAPILLNSQIGAYVSNLGESMHSRLSVAYTWGQIQSDIGNSQLNVVALEGVGFYQEGRHRIGGGLTYPVYCRLDSTEIGGTKYKLDRPFGYVAEYGFFFAPMKTWLILRSQYAKYSVPGEARSTFGSQFRDFSIGAGISLQFL